MMFRGVFLSIGILAIVITPGFTYNLPHPHHVSVTEIHYDSQNGSVQVSCKMYTADLEEALRILYNTKADIQKNINDSILLRLLHNYLSSHLEIRIQDQEVGLLLLGAEIEDESTWCYLESSTPVWIKESGAKSILIKNTVLFDFISEQINMIHCYFNEDRQSIKLTYPESEKSFSW